MKTEKRILSEQVSIMLRKMFFSYPVIEKYLEKVSYSELLSISKLLSDEQEARTIARRQRYIRGAQFPVVKSLDNYDFTGIKFPNLLSKDEMLTLDFVKDKKSLVFFGGCGTGKTHLMTALGLKACNNDYKVKFFTLSELVMHLKIAKENGSLDKFLKLLKNQDLLCIDEFGYVPLDLESAQFLFSVISNSYETQSLMITTNLPFSEWGTLFADDQLAAAIIDRIVHYGHLIQTGNKDWRLSHSLMNDK